ncbi:MAG: hypothetical protein P9L97_05795 [Candidatus Tenebribacter davisii]|nr:hypothetical protein [Candidatus Tenebribacter davisii]
MTDHEKAILIHFLMCKCDMYVGKINDMSVESIENSWYPDNLDKIIELGKASCRAHRRIHNEYIMNYKEYTWEELLEMDLQKDKLAEDIGIVCPFDTALPQTWLNNLVQISGLDYSNVRYSTFTTYPLDGGCVMVSAWKEVNKWL